MIRALRTIDWTSLLIIMPLLLAGLFTMKSFGGENASDYFFWRQIIWLALGLGVCIIFSQIDWRFFYSSGFLIVFYAVGLLVLVSLFLANETSWFQFSFFAIQPSEFMKLIVVLLLAKYFSRRHIEITQFRHVLISGLYAAIPAFLVLMQPDFGSAIIFFIIWLGMVISSGIPFRYLALVLGVAVIMFVVVWMLVLAPYQKDRILTFVNPYLDPQGAGYHILQTQIAVGSGQMFGQGVGYGIQSRLKFLPEHETDFIFAAFAEEWGFAGALLLIAFFIILIWRLLGPARASSDNFIRLFSIGLSLIVISHFIVHVGMNVGLLPITGLPLSFVSYGGSHLLMLFLALGIWMNMRQSRRTQVSGDEIDVS
ncbi:MAG: rod shape-determining protein RodA [Candidatus Niyogibacteria bacterium CG10_big_fil_rev_8_21_14_0_10_46_36]|uniref:Rod shape-determining protein RodA n=1 Tax=Candidatus Niyogibacteria bacterium CG10_big_fil_rev_8_21_14_0_10_46_36 TaxID=1974726 RepID=A0A2H0TFI3_9BACT|nr:MAG: rod shape-determining protein RodA [Candidatus Niyogibacteria bacterium CG10_big_fil_rev_8_21_14_0_10_46_36]